MCLNHSQETWLWLDVLFIEHVSCSRRLLEPSSAKIKREDVTQHVKRTKHTNSPILMGLLRQNLLNINSSLYPFVPEVFAFRERIFPPIPNVLQKLNFYVPRCRFTHANLQVFFHTCGFTPVFSKTSSICNRGFPGVLANAETRNTINTRVFTTNMWIDVVFLFSDGTNHTFTISPRIILTDYTF